MIVPSIDLRAGSTVQLVGGKDFALDAGDPAPIARRFARVGEVAVIDLDAALSTGSNADLIRSLCAIAPCRVGGGIRDEARARSWLDAGAEKIILGTAATPDLLRRLPRSRLIAALDADNGEVVVEGWRKPTGRGVLERIEELRPFVSGFLVTFVEREGRLGGTNLDAVPAIVQAAGDARVTIAGGVTTAQDVAALDAMGADAQVGMALYTRRLPLAEAFAAPLRSDRPDGLWPTVVQDERGVTLGLAYSSPESLARVIETGEGVYHSRRRGPWRKGETSGATQEVLSVRADCDRDALLFTVRQRGPGFCHNNTATCWGGHRGLSALETRIADAAASPTPGSYSARLLADPALLNAKLREEACELADAATPDHTRAEAADLLYFTLVALRRAGVSVAQVERELDARALRVSRRPGNAKPAFAQATTENTSAPAPTGAPQT